MKNMSIANKVIPFESLTKIRDEHPGKKIVHCHGVFDLFHFGHLAHLQSAKKYGDVLVVTLTPDRFVNKGPGRPRFTDQKRAAILASLELVDYVAINQFGTAVEPIEALKPHFYVKGPDYKIRTEDITGGIFEEEKSVKAGGGKIVFTEDEKESATELLNQYFSQWDETQRAAISKVKEAASFDQVKKIINDMSALKVLVVGEPIVDTYVFCQASGISTKSPTVSARFLNQEDYAGGSLAIANHLAALGCEVTLLITHGNEDYFKELLKITLNPSIKLVDYPVHGIPTPRKTRFLIPFQTQRIFELIDLRSDQWLKVNPSPFIERLTQLGNAADVMIAADFGHGMFEGDVLKALEGIKSFRAVNVQTNSGNFGFNPFTKHKEIDYLSIDERECRLATHDRLTPSVELAERTVKNLVKKKTSVTLGVNGSLYFDGEGKGHLCPTFFKEVIDTTGAGDAYFAVTSLLAKLNVPGPLVSFLGNCHAGLKTRIIGNKSAVSKVDLIRAVESILR
jgi:rfaE bifunctional protein nucleotidyltransferase chain/domain